VLRRREVDPRQLDAAAIADQPGADPRGMLPEQRPNHCWCQLAMIESPMETPVSRGLIGNPVPREPQPEVAIVDMPAGILAQMFYLGA
jgi:hypothetical protein